MWNPSAAPWQLCYGSTSWVARRGAYAGASVKSENEPDLKLTQDRMDPNDCWVALPPVAFEFSPISCCLPLLSDTQLFLLVGLQRKGAWAHWCPTQIGPSLKTGHSRGLQPCWLPQHYLFLRGFSYVPSCAPKLWISSNHPVVYPFGVQQKTKMHSNQRGTKWKLDCSLTRCSSCWIYSKTYGYFKVIQIWRTKY